MLFPSGGRGTAELAGVVTGSSGPLAHGASAHGQSVPSLGVFRLELIKMLMQPPNTDNTHPAWNHGFHSPSHNITWARAGLIYGMNPEFTHPSTLSNQWKKSHEILIRF